MISKDDREYMRRAATDPEVGCDCVDMALEKWVPQLLDALDEMEQQRDMWRTQQADAVRDMQEAKRVALELKKERDAALSARINAVEIRTGDVVVLRIRGAAETLAVSPEMIERVLQFCSAQLAAAGLDNKAMIMDANDSIDVLRGAK